MFVATPEKNCEIDVIFMLISVMVILEFHSVRFPGTSQSAVGGQTACVGRACFEQRLRESHNGMYGLPGISSLESIGFLGYFSH